MAVSNIACLRAAACDAQQRNLPHVQTDRSMIYVRLSVLLVLCVSDVSGLLCVASADFSCNRAPWVLVAAFLRLRLSDDPALSRPSRPSHLGGETPDPLISR